MAVAALPSPDGTLINFWLRGATPRGALTSLRRKEGTVAPTTAIMRCSPSSYCNRTATGPEQSRTEQEWGTAKGVEIRLFIRILLTGWDGVENAEAHSYPACRAG